MYSDSHHGLCRKCHSNFAFLLELEQKYGEDALILVCQDTYSSSERKEDLSCLIDHLIDFYQRNLIKLPSEEKYIRKMLFMLHSLQEPSDIESLR
jgi:hypothetical protein